MLHQIMLLFITCLLLLPCVSLGQDKQPVSYNDSDAYDVYSAVMPSEWAVRSANAKTLVIAAETNADFQMCLRPDAEWEKIIGGAISNYLEVNKKTWLIRKNIAADTPYKIISIKEIESAFEKGSWDGFYNRYPDSGGYIQLSAVGFNDDRTVAVVFTRHYCGMLCGGGSYNVLQKKDGKWVPLQWRGSRCAWAS